METGFQKGKKKENLSCVVSLNALDPLSLCLTLHACRCSPRWSNRSIFSQDSFAALYLQTGHEAAAFHSCAKPCWVISWELGEAEEKAAPRHLPLLELHYSTFPLWLLGRSPAPFSPIWTLAASMHFPQGHVMQHRMKAKLQLWELENLPGG